MYKHDKMVIKKINTILSVYKDLNNVVEFFTGKVLNITEIYNLKKKKIVYYTMA